MSGEGKDVSVTLPAELVEWLDEQAGDGRDREAVVRDLIEAYRSVDREDVDHGGIEDRLEAQREEYVELVEDVRERVIQVKREADSKAPADHAHPELRESVGTVEDRVSALAEDLDGLRSEIEDVSEEVESGFQNYEDVLEYLVDVTDAARSHLEAVDDAVLELHETTREVVEERRTRRAAEKLKAAANRKGVRTAACENCSASVDLGLLSLPECPECGASLSDVEPKSGFFGSATLVTGDPPAVDHVDVDGRALEDLDDAAPVGAVTPADPSLSPSTDDGNGSAETEDQGDPADAETGSDSGGDEQGGERR